MYYFLIRVYLNITDFTFQECVRRSNVLLLTLDSYKSNFLDIVKIIQSLLRLNDKKKLLINKKKIFVYVFTLIYTKDMS